jgi:hypothetical protein
MLLFCTLCATTASRADKSTKANRQTITLVNGETCFPPLGIIRSTILLLLSSSLVAFGGIAFYAMLKAYLQPAQQQIASAISSSSGDREPASFLSRREWETES